MASSAEAGGDKYRSFIDGEGEKNTVWRLGHPPNFDVVNVGIGLYSWSTRVIVTRVTSGQEDPSVRVRRTRASLESG